jgi:hypothetical protein
LIYAEAKIIGGNRLQVMRLIDDQRIVFGQKPASHDQIGKQERVVDNDDVSAVGTASCGT